MVDFFVIYARVRLILYTLATDNSVVNSVPREPVCITRNRFIGNIAIARIESFFAGKIVFITPMIQACFEYRSSRRNGGEGVGARFARADGPPSASAVGVPERENGGGRRRPESAYKWRVTLRGSAMALEFRNSRFHAVIQSRHLPSVWRRNNGTSGRPWERVRY